MKANDLLDIIGEANDEFIHDAKANQKTKTLRIPRLARLVAVAACFCLIVSGAWDTFSRLDYDFGAGCSAYPGEIVDGVYYYYIPHEGVMRYTPGGESERVLHTYWFEEWDVNEYGIYYWQDMSVYVRDHETGTRTKLYSASKANYSHIRFVLTEDGNVIVTHYNKYKEFAYELLIDGVTGEIIKTVMEPISYDKAKTVYYSDMNYIVGDRHIVLEPVDEKRNNFIVTEAGQNILPENLYASQHIEGYFGDVLCLSVWDGVTSYNGVTKTWLMLYPDGTDRIITIPEERFEGGTSEYIFYPAVADGKVGCVDTLTGEGWLLEADAETAIHDLEADGEYVYTCAPWAEETACWKLEYGEEGEPIGMTLISADISQSK